MWLTCVRGQTYFASLIHRLNSASCHVAPNNPRVHFRGGAEGKIPAIFPSKKYVELCLSVVFPSLLFDYFCDGFIYACKVFFPSHLLLKTQNSMSEKSSKFPSDNSCCNLYVCHCFLSVFSAAQHLDLISLSHHQVHNQSQVFSLQTKRDERMKRLRSCKRWWRRLKRLAWMLTCWWHFHQNRSTGRDFFMVKRQCVTAW